MISQPLPLFNWREAREAERLCRDRKALLGRIQKLRRIRTSGLLSKNV